MNCNQCQALMINGVFSHEAGCRNEGKTWDEEAGEWVRYRDCFYCGFPIREGERCDCLDPLEPEEEDEED